MLLAFSQRRGASILLKLSFRLFTFFLFPFYFFPQSIFHPLCPPLSFLHLFHTFVSFIYRFLTSVFLCSASVFLLSPYSLSPLLSQLHTLHNSISVFCVCFLPLNDLGSFFGLGAMSSSQDSQPKHCTVI